MNVNAQAALEELAAKIGGEIKEDGELYFGPPEHQIFITAQDEGTFFLASEHPLYSIKNGKPSRVRAGTKGDNAGWYYATVSPEQVHTVLELALGVTDNDKAAVEFAYEHILREYCAHNLTLVEPGLSIYEKDGRRGIEFPAGGRFIDILAVDSSGGLVVLEFKLSRGHERVIGQILRYVSWVRQHIATTDQRVRGIIIARCISDDLRLAAAGQRDIKLKQYSLTIELSDV